MADSVGYTSGHCNYGPWSTSYFFLDYIWFMLHEQCNYGQLPAAQLFSNVMRGSNTAANNMCCVRRSSQSLAKKNRAERIIDVL